MAAMPLRQVAKWRAIKDKSANIYVIEIKMQFVSGLIPSRSRR